MRAFWLGLIYLSVVTTGIGLWMPWAKIEWRTMRLQEKLADSGLGQMTILIREGDKTFELNDRVLRDLPSLVRGYEIPRLANAQHTQFALGIAALLGDVPKDIGAKSYLVFLVPPLAILFGSLLIWAGSRHALSAGIGITCGVLAGLGAWKILTLDLSFSIAEIHLGLGVWAMIAAFCGLCLAGCSSVLVSRTQKGLR